MGSVLALLIVEAPISVDKHEELDGSAVFEMNGEVERSLIVGDVAALKHGRDDGVSLGLIGIQFELHDIACSIFLELF